MASKEDKVTVPRLIDRIGQCLTMVPELGEGPLGVIKNAAIAIEDKKIVWVGPRDKLPKEYRERETTDAHGALVTPGLIDCHTHAMFAGSRADEFFLRLQGKSYEEIAKAGGGIAKTVRMTREASDEELLLQTQKRLDEFWNFGVTTVEIKSGYGLSVEQELRLLRLMKKVQHSVEVVPTFLGAHTIPSEFKSNRKEYVRLVCEEMLPQVAKEKLSDICDVFCEEIAFTVEETRQIFSTAKKLGFKLKLHADQLTGGGGAEVAAEFGAISADHLENISERGINALAKAGTVGVLLPGAVFFLGKRNYPNARKLINGGVKVAISTDCNPGTSMTTNLPLMMTFAAVELKMTCEEIWQAVTVNAAKALTLDAGRIQKNGCARLLEWDCEAAEDVIYKFASTYPRILSNE